MIVRRAFNHRHLCAASKLMLIIDGELVFYLFIFIFANCNQPLGPHLADDHDGQLELGALAAGLRCPLPPGRGGHVAGDGLQVAGPHRPLVEPPAQGGLAASAGAGWGWSPEAGVQLLATPRHLRRAPLPVNTGGALGGSCQHGLGLVCGGAPLQYQTSNHS